MKIAILLLAAGFLAGCAGNVELLKRAETAEQTNRFRVIATDVSPEPGYADLTVRASVKTHTAVGAPFGQDPHGTPGYVLLVNIDGEPLRISGVRSPEERDQDSGRDPEEGDGTRYLFRAHLRLPAGAHRIIVALPDDGVAVQREIRLDGMTDSLLEVTPSYYSDRRQRGPGSTGATSFREGIGGLELTLRGTPL